MNHPFCEQFRLIVELGIVLVLIQLSLGLEALKAENDHRQICQCGSNANHVDRRVVGGHNAAIGEFPYATGLMVKDAEYYRMYQRHSLYCGATLITNKHVLTAAHCVRDRQSRDILVDIGDYDLRTNRGTSIRKTYRQARSLNKHLGYVKETFQNDIALIELERSVPLNTSLKAAWLAPPGFELSSDATATVYGWGRLSYTGRTPYVLQTLDLPIMDNSACQERFLTKISDEMICAGGHAGQDACAGDSGSGLVTKVDDEFVVVGVVSFGRRCALPDVPGVYTKVSHFVDWIYEQTKNATCRPCIAKDEK